MIDFGIVGWVLNRYNQRVADRRMKAGKKSYSQSGEDLIVDFILEHHLRIPKPTYLDIGAHEPTYLSNTYHFYEKGCNGVCIEPDRFLFEAFKKKRKRDLCLNVGIGFEQQSRASFYVMSTKSLSTFSKSEAERYQSYGEHRIEQVILVDLIPINTVLNDNFPICPNFISLDVEGLDYEILRSMDFKKYRPEIFCVETITFTEDKSETKVVEIISFMESQGYFVYADTCINTIFVDKCAWQKRQ